MKVKFVVLGEPQGKGRPRFSKVGNHVQTRTPDETLIYENLIRSEYQRQCGSARFQDEAQLDVRILAFYPVPTSVSKKKRRMMLDHEIRPGKKPDWDNIGKVVTDSLNQIAYRDDAQVKATPSTPCALTSTRSCGAPSTAWRRPSRTWRRSPSR